MTWPESESWPECWPGWATPIPGGRTPKNSCPPLRRTRLVSGKQCYSTQCQLTSVSQRRASPTSDAAFATITSMKIAGLLSRSGRELPGVTGLARVDRHAEALARRVGRGDIAVFDQVDLDRRTADALVAAGVAGVVNAAPSISGRFPNLGPEILVCRRNRAGRRGRCGGVADQGWQPAEAS